MTDPITTALTGRPVAALSTALPDGFRHLPERPDGLVVVAPAADPSGVAGVMPDVVLVDADRVESIDAARAMLAGSPPATAVGVLGSDLGLVQELVDEFGSTAPTVDLLDVLTTVPAAALWMMRRPRPSLGAVAAALGLIAGAEEISFAGHTPQVGGDTVVIPAADRGEHHVVRTELDQQFLRDVAAATGGTVRNVVTPSFDHLPHAIVDGRKVAVVVRVDGRADLARVLAEQVRVTSDLPVIALAGPEADRAELGRAGIAVVDVPRLVHDGTNRLSPLWALTLTPLDRVLFVHDVVVHDDVRPLFAGDDFHGTTSRRTGAVASPNGQVFVASPSVRLARHVVSQFSSPAFHNRGLGQELGDIFLDWKALRSEDARPDGTTSPSRMTVFGAVKPWHLAAPRANRPADTSWFETAASLDVSAGRDPLRLLRAVRGLVREGDYRAAAGALAASKPMGRSRVVKEIARQGAKQARRAKK